ncbi:MAG TPA: DUF374 domain-containing protein [Nitrospiria bacterium]|nr:DUF374 domain-containing protein [Nitrospiria bacterium]
MTKTFHKRFFFFPVFVIVWVLVQLYHRTCRVAVNGPLSDHLESDRPLLLAWWHQDMLFNFVYLTRFAKSRKIATIVSQSKDGDLAAYLVKQFGITPIRGSSSKGGKEALDRLTAYVRKERAIGIVVCDGPRPPGRVAKFGIVALARATGYPIVKVRSWGARQHIFTSSWCKLLLIYPFSRVTIWSEAPLSVPADACRNALEEYRLEVERGLNRMADLSEQPAG